MIQWDHKTSLRQLLLLLSCLAIVLPGMASPAVCLDCDSCDLMSTSSDRHGPKSCDCCDPPVEEKPSCCDTKTTDAIQSSCHCQDARPAPQSCLMAEKTENSVSSFAPHPVSACFASPLEAVSANGYHGTLASYSDPEFLRSVILLI